MNGPGRVVYPVDGAEQVWLTEGASTRAATAVLMDADDDLTASSTWADEGYVVAKLFDEEEIAATVRSVERLVGGWVRDVLGELPADFTLAHHHRFVDEAAHLAVVGGGRCYQPLSEVGDVLPELEERVSEIVGTRVTALARPGVAPYFGVRIVRPSSSDANPLHRDAWLPALRNTLTTYLPICGSTARSSLGVVAGSHRWPEDVIERTDGGATVDGREFTVPAVLASSIPIEVTRPNPGSGDVLVFSPYLLHGGARSEEVDLTRVSLELRFMRAPDRLI